MSDSAGTVHPDLVGLEFLEVTRFYLPPKLRVASSRAALPLAAEKVRTKDGS